MKSIAAAILGAAVLACPAFSTSFTTTVGINSKTDSTPVCFSDSGPGFSEDACAGGTVGSAGSAAAGGVLNVSAFTQATANITDILFSGPGSTVPATVTLAFNSVAIGEYQTWAFGSSGVSGGFQFGVSVAGSPTSVIEFDYSGDSNGDSQKFPDGDSVPGWAFTLVPTFDVTLLKDDQGNVGAEHGFSYTWNGGYTFTTTFPVGTPVSILMGMTGSCGAGSSRGFPADCKFDALDPFGFIPGTVAFQLPEGYTVNAPSIGLVDGMIPSAGVPEPRSTVVLVTGCILILGMRFRKRSS